MFFWVPVFFLFVCTGSPCLVQFSKVFPDFKQKNLWKMKIWIEKSVIWNFQTLQNLVKTTLNLLKNLNSMNFWLFHGLKPIQNNFKPIITRKIWVLCVHYEQKRGLLNSKSAAQSHIITATFAIKSRARHCWKHRFIAV